MGDFEVIIVGGGIAGLSAALVLGRCRRRTLVCDSGEPRNARSRALHGRRSLPPLKGLRPPAINAALQKADLH